MRELEGSANDFVQALGDVLEILGVQAGHGDSSVARHVDVRLLVHAGCLLRSDAREAIYSLPISN